MKERAGFLNKLHFSQIRRINPNFAQHMACTNYRVALRAWGPPSGRVPNVIRITKSSWNMCRSAPTDVFVLDYDGVIADSAREVATAGLGAATLTWPQFFAALTLEETDRILAGLAATRPRLVRGYESMVMARLILEDPTGGVDAVLAPGWDAPGGLLASSLAAWGTSEGELNPRFEEWRAARLAADPAAWLAFNPLYAGVGEALGDCPHPYYIASSKRSDRLTRLLRAQLPALADLPDASPRVLAGLIPPNERKIAALREVAGRPIAADPVATTLHFIDDRFETIEAIAAQPDLAARYSLYLAAWGYNTAEERAAAAKELPGVRVITLPQFCELLRFGIVMGVDDGCQDTPEEALAGVYRPFGCADE